MPFESRLFRQSNDPRLEDCLVKDSAHITRGARGDHVKTIQIALNQLSNVFLAIDGNYGPKTAAAVRAYKEDPKRRTRIHTRGQTTVDDIVGKGTIKSLDDEMDIFENESLEQSLFVSTTNFGAPHDHTRCPGKPLVASPGADGRAQHRGTPINPQPGGGRSVNIGGEFETQYLGFEDFVTDGPPLNNISIFSGSLIRPFTQTLPARSVNNLCMRATPVTHARMSQGDGQGEREISRIAMPGCRFTFATNQGFFEGVRPFLLSLGTLIEDNTVFDVNDSTDTTGLRVLVIVMRGDGRFVSQSSP